MTHLLTLILLTWRIWWAPNNASKWQMGFNWACKGQANTHLMLPTFLKYFTSLTLPELHGKHTQFTYLTSSFAVTPEKPPSCRSMVWFSIVVGKSVNTSGCFTMFPLSIPNLCDKLKYRTCYTPCNMADRFWFYSEATECNYGNVTFMTQ